MTQNMCLSCATRRVVDGRSAETVASALLQCLDDQPVVEAASLPPFCDVVAAALACITQNNVSKVVDLIEYLLYYVEQADPSLLIPVGEELFRHFSDAPQGVNILCAALKTNGRAAFQKLAAALIAEGLAIASRCDSPSHAELLCLLAALCREHQCTDKLLAAVQGEVMQTLVHQVRFNDDVPLVESCVNFLCEMGETAMTTAQLMELVPLLVSTSRITAQAVAAILSDAMERGRRLGEHDLQVLRDFSTEALRVQPCAEVVSLLCAAAICTSTLLTAILASPPCIIEQCARHGLVQQAALKCDALVLSEAGELLCHRTKDVTFTTFMKCASALSERASQQGSDALTTSVRKLLALAIDEGVSAMEMCHTSAATLSSICRSTYFLDNPRPLKAARVVFNAFVENQLSIVDDSLAVDVAHLCEVTNVSTTGEAVLPYAEAVIWLGHSFRDCREIAGSILLRLVSSHCTCEQLMGVLSRGGSLCAMCAAGGEAVEFSAAFIPLALTLPKETVPCFPLNLLQQALKEGPHLSTQTTLRIAVYTAVCYKWFPTDVVWVEGHPTETGIDATSLISAIEMLCGRQSNWCKRAAMLLIAEAIDNNFDNLDLCHCVASTSFVSEVVNAILQKRHHARYEFIAKLLQQSNRKLVDFLYDALISHAVVQSVAVQPYTEALLRALYLCLAFDGAHTHADDILTQWIVQLEALQPVGWHCLYVLCRRKEGARVDALQQHIVPRLSRELSNQFCTDKALALRLLQFLLHERPFPTVEWDSPLLDASALTAMMRVERGITGPDNVLLAAYCAMAGAEGADVAAALLEQNCEEAAMHPAACAIFLAVMSNVECSLYARVVLASVGLRSRWREAVAVGPTVQSFVASQQWAEAARQNVSSCRRLSAACLAAKVCAHELDAALDALPLASQKQGSCQPRHKFRHIPFSRSWVF